MLLEMYGLPLTPSFGCSNHFAPAKQKHHLRVVLLLGAESENTRCSRVFVQVLPEQSSEDRIARRGQTPPWRSQYIRPNPHVPPLRVVLLLAAESENTRCSRVFGQVLPEQSSEDRIARRGKTPPWRSQYIRPSHFFTAYQ